MSIRKHILFKLNSIIITLVFFIAIFIPFSIGIIEKDQDISIIEKRKLAKFPKIGEDIKKFPKSFDKYYSDHFGLRDWFTKYYKLVKFKLGDSPSSDVTIGKDGWLFLGSIKKGYKPHHDPMGDARNISLFTKNDLKTFALRLASLKAWLNDKGAEYMLVIAPNKHTVYSDKLPDYITKTNEQSSTDQLIEALKSYTNVPIVDLRKKLIENKNKYPLYDKTGTHWNHYGANIAQYEIMLKIRELFPKLIYPEVIKLKKGIIKGGNDLANFIGVHNFIEQFPQPIFENSCEPILAPRDPSNRKIFSYTCEGQKLNALIFRDSFFVALRPYFSRKFKRSTYISERVNYLHLEKYIKSENPTIVIEEWAERKLPFIPWYIPEFNKSINKKLFKCSENPLFISNFKKLKYNKHIEIIESTNKSIKLKSIGKDPAITFPLLLTAKEDQYIIHIKAKFSVNSMLQLFYSDDDTKSYSEQNSVRMPINPGWNDIYFLLDYSKLGKQLRLDPISKLGDIEFKTIEIRKIKDNLMKTCS